MKLSPMMLIAAAGIVVALSGCSQTTTTTAPSNASPRPTVAMSKAEAQELSDGKVTYEEYKAAFARYVACDAKAGYKVTDTGEQNEVVNYFVSAAAVNSGVDDRCQHQQFWDVDTKWQISREDTSAQAADYSKCLIRVGITPKATEDEKFHQLQAAHLDPTSCYVSDGATAAPAPQE